jgi:hypothetical protein
MAGGSFNVRPFPNEGFVTNEIRNLGLALYAISREDQSLKWDPQPVVSGSPFGSTPAENFRESGTEGSNPLSSSNQSVSTVNPEAIGEKPRTLAAVYGWLGT